MSIWGFNLAIVMVALLLAYSGARRSKSFVPYGVTGVGLGMWLCATTFTDIAGWSTVVVGVVTAVLYFIAIKRPDVKERLWHLAALAAGLLGWALCAGMATVWTATEGRADISKRELLVVLIFAAAFILALTFLGFKWMFKWSRKSASSKAEKINQPDSTTSSVDTGEEPAAKPDQPPIHLVRQSNQ